MMGCSCFGDVESLMLRVHEISDYYYFFYFVGFLILRVLVTDFFRCGLTLLLVMFSVMR